MIIEIPQISDTSARISTYRVDPSNEQPTDAFFELYDIRFTTLDTSYNYDLHISGKDDMYWLNFSYRHEDILHTFHIASKHYSLLREYFFAINTDTNITSDHIKSKLPELFL